MTIVHGSLGSFVTSFHRYHSSLGPFFLTVFDRRAHLATLGSVDDKGRRNRAPPLPVSSVLRPSLHGPSGA